MPVRSALENSGKFLRNAAPQLHENARRTTTRDIGTVGLSTALVSVVTWLVHDVAKLPIPVEVAVSIANILGFFIARKFMY